MNFQSGNDLPRLTIFPGNLLHLYAGEAFEEDVPESWDVQQGDVLEWECGDNDGGFVAVMDRLGEICVLRKYSTEGEKLSRPKIFFIVIVLLFVTYCFFTHFSSQ